MATYEMLWDCKNCDTKKLLGKTHRFCPNCGGPQDPAWRYFPSDAEKVAVEDHKFVGVDRICPACDVPNSAAAKHCVACGCDLDKAKEAVTRSDQVKAEGAAFAGETAKDAKAERQARKNPQPVQKPARSKKPFIIGGVIAAILAFIIVAIVWKEEAVITVSSHHWEREIDVEKFGPKSESAWCSEMPSDGYRVSRSREVRSHRQVPDGQTCKTRRRDKGDGTYSESQECTTKYRSEPVYDDRCRYTVDRWQHERTLKTAGQSLADVPAWPAVTLSRAGQCMGCEREGPRREKYEVDIVRDHKGKTQVSTCGYAQQKWADIKDGSKWKMKFAVITGLPDCSSMLPIP